MNIALITDLYPIRDNEIHTPKTLFDFVQSWKSLGHNVSVIKPNFILNSFIRRKPFYKAGFYGDVLNLNYWLPFIGKINVPKPILNADIVVAHMPSGILFADRLNLPFIAGIHQSDIDVLTKPVYKFYFGKRLYKALVNAKAIACRSEHLKQKLLKLYPEFSSKTFTAPSGIDENIIVNREEDFSSPIKIFTAANFIKRKNLDKLIEAVGAESDFNLTIAGKGREDKRLRKLAAKFDNIKFTGILSHNDVLKKMRQSDIFILPSENETFGLVYIEAMASGCVTVGTRGTGCDGIIVDGKNGFLTKPDTKSIKSILNELKNFDKNRLKTLRENSFSTIKNYTKTACAKNYLQQILKFLNDMGN